MPRRYRRRYARVSRPLKTVKYSNETFNAGNDVPMYITPAQGAVAILEFDYSVVLVSWG